MLGWFCAMTQANAEIKAADRLKKDGYDVFLPVVHKISRHARKMQTVKRPYFPRYLFIHYDPGRQSTHRIDKTEGIVRVLRGSNALPAAIPSAFIINLQALASANGGVIPLDDQPQPTTSGRPEYRPGKDLLRVTGGPFGGLEGLFDRDEGKRVAVMLSLFRGGKTRVVFDHAQVRLAS